MRNLEFKAELRDPQMARAVCRAIKATPIGTLRQTDTYYRVPSGRLKKRETRGEPTEYIFYDRARGAHPKVSTFTIYSEAAAQERFGREPLPVWITVHKSRELWMHNNVRIHIDSVEGLGLFLEFEAMLGSDGELPQAAAALAELRKVFGPALGEAIDRGYADLMEAGAGE